MIAPQEWRIPSAFSSEFAIGLLADPVDETHGWERATPMALIGSVIHKIGAIGVARS